MSSNSDHLQTPCPHLTRFKSATSFRTLLSRLHVRPLGRACLRSAHPFRCGACGSRAPRLYLCPSCDAVACESHAPDHEHGILIDVDRAELFCGACGDQVYDRDFDSAVVLSQTAAETLGGCSSLLAPPPESLRKRRRVEYRAWTPDSKERALLGLGLHSSESDIPIGLRGLNNLGNTCFMNSVLQALLHTPPLRNYFLSDRHNRFVCQQKNGINQGKGKNDKMGKNLQRLCLACDTDALFSAVFSGDRNPYSPAKFLYRCGLVFWNDNVK